MNKNESAFPQEVGVGNFLKLEGGLTKREYLAMKIYAENIDPFDSHGQIKSWAKYSVQAADALLEALEESDNGSN
jgi:hypothetical protein